MAHVQVADVDATAALARELGAKVLNEPTDIPTVGRFAVIEDPQGASISLFKPNQATDRHDPSVTGEFCWSELLAKDSAAAFQFYSRILPGKLLDEMDMGPMGKCRVFGMGEQQIGGMMNCPEGGPAPAWGFYMETNELEAAVARATQAGATVMNGPMEVPGGARIVQLRDPLGAAFAAHELAKK